MSVRNMLKVMMSLLLAMALAATPAHAARLDRSYASVAKEALQVKGKSETIVKSEVFPYEECEEKCDGVCICILIWPPPETCICAATIQPSSTVGEAKELYNKLDLLAGPVQRGTSGDDKKMVVWTKGKMEAIPYEECVKTCELCVCTLPWPPEASICICITPKLDVLAGPVQKGTSGDDKKMVVWTKGKMEAIPYKECIKTCELCACTLPWPPEASICICITPKPQVVGVKALAM